jgi:hypothetical protein
MPSIPQIVRARLQRPMPATVDSHPDADLLTAFAEQSLVARERGSVLEHLAHCRDCRDVVALALPATEAVAATGLTSNARIGGFSWPVLRWAVAAAGILVVTSLGVLQYERRHQEKTMVATSLAPQNRTVESSAPSPAPSAQAPSPMTAPPTATKKQSATRENALSRPMPPAGSAGGMAGGVRGQFSSAAGQAPTAAPVSPQRDDESAPASADELEVVGKAKPALAQGSPSNPVPLPHTDTSFTKNQVAPRWIISSSGALQRSIDGGKTWLDVIITVDAAPADMKSSEKQLAPAPTVFRALAVSSNAEVWAGGSSGALYHTVDGGIHWVRVAPSTAGFILTGDVISIEFADPQNGTITTSNAEVWTTPNDGRTWQKKQ